MFAALYHQSLSLRKKIQVVLSLSLSRTFDILKHSFLLSLSSHLSFPPLHHDETRMGHHLQDAGAMKLLRPLLLDVVPSIQQNAAAALGRLASHSEDLAEDVVANEILPQLVYSLSEQNRFYKRAAAFVLRSVAKHSPELALAVVVRFFL